MALSSSNIIVFLAVSLILLGTSCDAGFLLHKTQVEIKNCMPGGQTLTMGCKSKNDDLGMHDLGPQGTFTFHFRPSFFLSTQYWCHFQWDNGALHFYDVYIQSRDYKRCKDCYWCIKPDGPCLFNDRTKAYDRCDKWNK